MKTTLTTLEHHRAFLRVEGIFLQLHRTRQRRRDSAAENQICILRIHTSYSYFIAYFKDAHFKISLSLSLFLSVSLSMFICLDACVFADTVDAELTNMTKQLVYGPFHERKQSKAYALDALAKWSES